MEMSWWKLPESSGRFSSQEAISDGHLSAGTVGTWACESERTALMAERGQETQGSEHERVSRKLISMKGLPESHSRIKSHGHGTEMPIANIFGTGSAKVKSHTRAGIIGRGTEMPIGNASGTVPVGQPLLD